jgi:hypothetical protein
METKMKDFIKHLAEIQAELPDKVVFNPPQIFIQVKSITSLEIDDEGIASVLSSGPSFFYVNTPDIEKLLSLRAPDFTVL